MDDSVKQYIDSIPEDRKPLFEKLQSLIYQIYPDVKVVISYQVPIYKRSSGWVGLGVWKGGISIYAGSRPIEGFQLKYPNRKTGKGSVQFGIDEELPIEDIKHIIMMAIERS